MQKLKVLLLVMLLLPTFTVAETLIEVGSGTQLKSSPFQSLQAWSEQNPGLFWIGAVFIVASFILIAHWINKNQGKNRTLEKIATVGLILLIGTMLFYLFFG